MDLPVERDDVGAGEAVLRYDGGDAVALAEIAHAVVEDLRRDGPSERGAREAGIERHKLIAVPGGAHAVAVVDVVAREVGRAADYIELAPRDGRREALELRAGALGVFAGKDGVEQPVVREHGPARGGVEGRAARGVDVGGALRIGIAEPPGGDYAHPAERVGGLCGAHGEAVGELLVHEYAELPVGPRTRPGAWEPSP